MEYEIGTDIIFAESKNYNATPYVTAGLSGRESWGTWTLGNEFKMRFRTNSNKEMLHGSIECGAFNASQSYIIYVNDKKVAEEVATGENIEFDFYNPSINKIVDIRIELPDANSPLNLGQSEDSRILGLGLK